MIHSMPLNVLSVTLTVAVVPLPLPQPSHLLITLISVINATPLLIFMRVLVTEIVLNATTVRPKLEM